MPNYCDNELKIRGKSGVLACLERIRGEPDKDGPMYIDFRKIVPMPAILAETEPGSDADMGRILLGDDALGQEMLSYPWVQEKGITDLDGLRKYIREHHPDAEEAGKHSIQAEQKTGCRDWWEWRVGNLHNHFKDGHWGTKWNACWSSLADNTTDTQADLGFSTAWSPPLPVIVELSKQFPKLTFTLKYWEGGIGFRGIFRAKAGNILRDNSYGYSGPRGG